MSKVFAVAKSTANAETATDPNDFIFHSDYNTFKIILEGTESITVSASASKEVHSIAHGLSFIPLVTAFAKESTRTEVFTANTANPYVSSIPLVGRTGISNSGLVFDYVESDATNVYFIFSENNGTSRTVTVKYYCLEEI